MSDNKSTLEILAIPETYFFEFMLLFNIDIKTRVIFMLCVKEALSARYCYGESLYENGQDFLDIQHII